MEGVRKARPDVNERMSSRPIYIGGVRDRRTLTQNRSDWRSLLERL